MLYCGIDVAKHKHAVAVVDEPRPGRFTHHLELYSPADIDQEVCEWLPEAWAQAG